MIGDSLMEHHSALIEGLLLDMEDYHTDLITASGRFLYLNPAHPDAAAILAEAGVSPSRAKRPIVMSYRVDHIFDEDELRMLFSHANDRLEIRPKNHTRWYPEILTLISKEVEFVRRDVKEEPTILLTSLGPHWMFGDLGLRLNVDDMTFAYRKAVSDSLCRFRGL